MKDATIEQHGPRRSVAVKPGQDASRQAQKSKAPALIATTPWPTDRDRTPQRLNAPTMPVDEQARAVDRPVAVASAHRGNRF